MDTGDPRMKRKNSKKITITSQLLTMLRDYLGYH
jgi:hypothetical protein